MNGIILSLHQKRGRRLRVDVDEGVGFKTFLGQGNVARIDDDGKVRPTRERVGVVHRSIHAIGVERADRRGQVASGRKAQHAGAFGINVPLRRMFPHQADGALRIL